MKINFRIGECRLSFMRIVPFESRNNVSIDFTEAQPISASYAKIKYLSSFSKQNTYFTVKYQNSVKNSTIKIRTVKYKADRLYFIARIFLILCQCTIKTGQQNSFPSVCIFNKYVPEGMFEVSIVVSEPVAIQLPDRLYRVHRCTEVSD